MTTHVQIHFQVHYALRHVTQNRFVTYTVECEVQWNNKTIKCMIHAHMYAFACLHVLVR